MKKYRHNKNSESGIALLFALGILSLLLVLGLGFVTNSLLARKVAFNNSSRTQAKMLGQSAISRVALAIMQFQYQTQQDATAWPDDFTNIYSYGEIKKNSSDPLTTDDQLQYPSTKLNERFSKLNYFNGVLDYDGYKNNHTKWVFLFDRNRENPNDDNGKIIGRIAYQVLPATSTSRLNMQHVLQGFEDGAWQHRQGKDINELYIDATEVFTDPNDSTKHWSSVAPSSANERMDAVPSDYDTLRSAYGLDFFYNDDGVEEEDGDRISWVKRWFAEGEKMAGYEAFEIEDNGEIRKYNRFNLSKSLNSAPALNENGYYYDDWYWRFSPLNAETEQDRWLNWLTSNNNNDDALENLADRATSFKEIAKNSPYDSGLPFLKQIGDTAGTFTAGTAALAQEYFRKQIAANLNDYCDRDEIPTSDVPAVDWKNAIPVPPATTATGSQPNYTGNEKDFYINEIGFAFQADPALANSDLEPFKAKGSKLKAELSLTPHLLVELIDIYGLSQDATLKELTFQTYLKTLKLGFKVTITGELVYKIPAGDPAVMTEQPPETFTETLEDTATDPLQLLIQMQKLDLSFPEADGSLAPGGYRAQNLVLTPAESPVADFSSVFKTKLDAHSGAELVSAKITKISFEAVNFSYQLGPMVLSRKVATADKNPDSATDLEKLETGIDFVKDFPEVNVPASGETFSFPLFPQTGLPGTLSTLDVSATGEIQNPAPAASDLSPLQKTFFLGGMEVYDPRQNLNVKEYVDPVPPATDSSDANANSDWYFKPAFANFENKNDAISINIDETGGSPDIAKLTGQVNRYSNPASPGQMAGLTAGTGFDKETVSDPAWKGDGADQHLSTAFIRNAPMESPWELGAIHRAQAWRTLNLKKAERPGGGDMRPEDFYNNANWDEPGTTYENGDGALLEQIKMTPGTRCFGKLDVNMLLKDNPSSSVNPEYASAADKPKDDDMIKALFANLSLERGLGKIDDPPSSGDVAWVLPDDISSAIIARINDARSSSGTFQNRIQFLNTGLAKGFGLWSDAVFNDLPDADQEEVAGKTINLLGVQSSELPSTVQVLIIAQSIRDIGGDGTNVAITKILPNGISKTKEDCRQGQFDCLTYDSSDFTTSEIAGIDLSNTPDQWLYYDEITGEVKMLVTLDRDPTANSGRLVVRKIEYLE